MHISFHFYLFTETAWHVVKRTGCWRKRNHRIRVSIYLFYVSCTFYLHSWLIPRVQIRFVIFYIWKWTDGRIGYGEERTRENGPTSCRRSDVRTWQFAHHIKVFNPKPEATNTITNKFSSMIIFPIKKQQDCLPALCLDPSDSVI